MNVFIYLVGRVTIVVLCSLFIDFIVFKIIDGVENLKYRHKLKRRFNKPLTAKCYCRDCIFHGDYGKCCSFSNKYTADDCFCCEAQPKELNGNERY
mgnify:CR=1 FL=1